MALMLSLLMLTMAVQSDADSSCPLFLGPPELVAEYGEEIEVNCSSNTDANHRIFWNDENEEFADEGSATWTVPAMPDWNMNPKCTIKINESYVCSESLPFTLFKKPDSVDLFSTNSAAHGKEYHLQCNIVNVAPVQKLIVKWFKGDVLMKTHNFTNKTKTPVSESSNLTVILSREDNGTTFRCEAHMDVGPREPAVVSAELPVLHVKYAPDFQQIWDNIRVTEGHNVSLDCDADGYPLPTFLWSTGQTERTVVFPGVMANKNVNCSATNQQGTRTKQFVIHVMMTTTSSPDASTALVIPKKVCSLEVTPARLVVKYGDSISINCSSSIKEEVNWEIPVGRVTERNRTLQMMNLVTWTVLKFQEFKANPICYNLNGCTKHPLITLYKPPDTVSISLVNQSQMEEGSESELECNIRNVAPVQNLTVYWYNGTQPIWSQVSNSTEEVPTNQSFRLTITPSSNDDKATYKCEAQLDLGPAGPQPLPSVVSEPYIADVHYKPQIREFQSKYEGLEYNFTLSMVPYTISANPRATVLWYRHDVQFNSSTPLSRMDSGTFTLEATNTFGQSRSNRTINITVEYRPAYTCSHYFYEIKENHALDLQCTLEGIPKPLLVWLKDGNHVSFQTPFTRNNTGQYVAKATNRHGTAQQTLHVNVLYGPEFQNGNSTMDIISGSDLHIDCNAVGNPTPVVHWIYNSTVNIINTTEGRQSINFTGATSTDAGVYICIATNKLGSVTRSTTLKIRAAGIQGLIWILCLCLIIALLVVVVVIALLYFHRSKRYGTYDFQNDVSLALLN